MIRPIAFAAGALTGVLYYNERRKRAALERLAAATLESLLDAIDANNPETGAHTRRVAEYALELADAADLDDRTQYTVELVALFHDIGKLDEAISDIVSEPTELSPADWRAVMRHPQKGADVLRPLGAFYPNLPKGVLAHHERWDGTGYPKQLHGTAIPVEARVVAIADTFDAITHSRAYSDARSLDSATEIISKGRGTQFDPDLVDLFLSPPVIAEVAKAMKRTHSPRRAYMTRRRKCVAGVPDVTFRWRKQAPVPR